MARMKTVQVQEATGKVKRILQHFDKNGHVPNVFADMANCAITLDASVTLDRLIGAGTLTPAEQVAAKLVVSQHFDCEYCLAACTAVGAHRGLSAEQMLAIRRGRVDDVSLDALVQFTRRMLETKGAVEEDDIDRFRAAGYAHEQMLEVVTIIGAIALGSHFNNLNRTALDFPKAPDL
jgi:AhpD family alkylhydroperoxidase